MGQLIDDLLNLSRLGRLSLKVYPVNMQQLVQDVINELLLMKSLPVAIECGQLLPASCDGNLLRQVWMNLISNAVKYSGKSAHPRIEINSCQQDGEITYSVKDNGVGFDMKYADKLFGVFQRMHKLTEFEGTGVGLALVQRIIVKHGGKVWADAQVNKGAAFYFSLPVSNKK
jgi:light-regulated signal transduction histidine kinase (bacteriophytochrome)